jgi:hypothetical protein
MNQPWFNFENYTPMQATLFLIGVVFWIWAYITVVVNNHKNKTLGIPIAAVCLNFGWEIATTFFFTDQINMGKLFVVGYTAWFGVDCLIVYQMFKYGENQIITPYLKKQLYWLLIVGLVGSTVAQTFFMIGGFDLPMAVVSAYIINLAMSIAYCGLVFVPDYRGLSKTVAWTKALGTEIISVCFFLKYPDKHFLTVMYLLVFFFDALYIYWLHKLSTDIKN